ELNFSFFQLSLLLAAIPFFSLIFEIPTGAIADLYGRKFSVILGVVLQAAGFLLLFFFTNYYSLILIMGFLGIASTLVSGAEEAWITDLINRKNKNLLKYYFGKKYSIMSFALIFSGIIGAFLVDKFGLRIIWMVSAGALFLSSIILLFGEEIHKKRKIKIKSSIINLKNQTKISINYCYKHHVLFYIFFASMFLVISVSFFSMLTLTDFLKNLGLKDSYFGYLWSGLSFLGFLGPLVGSSILKKNKERFYIFLTIFISAIFLIILSFIKGLYLALGLIFLSFFINSMISPGQRVYFHKFIPAKLRATIGSVESMLLSLIGIFSLPLAGLVLDNFGANIAILISGVFLIPSAIIYFKINEERE
ncbi:MFS transporter, partial [Candidatus Pacearchaeota archaeon]|nr:MFS transporter [Candidatus Pacearchaeota archaeon]MBD3283409.1 MFS transporter [Candidatus Pacearchaeota archaeon]